MHRYSNIERELLGVVFELERLHHYTFGKPIIVETGHQPLTSIWKKTTDTSSPRLQTLLLRQAQYDVHIEVSQRKGKCYSRCPLQSSISQTRVQRLQQQSEQHRKKSQFIKSHKQHQPVQKDYKKSEKPQQKTRH